MLRSGEFNEDDSRDDRFSRHNRTGAVQPRPIHGVSKTGVHQGFSEKRSDFPERRSDFSEKRLDNKELSRQQGVKIK